MNVAKILDERRAQWQELEQLCDSMETSGRTEKTGKNQHRGAAGVARFASLYRSACADLALADAYQLPPGTVTYLHRLVARAHNQLYRAGKLSPYQWVDVVFQQAPKQIYSDPCVRIASVIFFGLFLLAMTIGSNEALFPQFAQRIVGEQSLSNMEESYREPLNAAGSTYIARAAFYIRHNTGIGLRCFAYGILIIPCLYTLAFNAVQLGTSFGYMSQVEGPSGDHFFEFVTAHGPFELSAIALAAAAGLRLGVGLFYTNGLSRLDSIRENGKRSVPIMAASAILFVLAAFTEGFISPSPLPYVIKAFWAVGSSSLISFYFVILGFPQNESTGLTMQSGRYADLEQIEQSRGERKQEIVPSNRTGDDQRSRQHSPRERDHAAR